MLWECLGHPLQLCQELSLSLIQCTAEAVPDVITATGCSMKELPITYLGLPLSLQALTRAELQPLIDRIAAQLPT